MEQVAILARAGLERWARYVRLIPLVAVLEEHRQALRTLVNWYERVCSHDDFVDEVPTEGEGVLSDLGLSHLRSASDPFAVAQAAVRIAGELVDYRRRLVSYRRLVFEGEPFGELIRQQFLSQLEVASHCVSDFLETPA